MKSIYVNGKLVAVLFDTCLEVDSNKIGISAVEDEQVSFVEYLESVIVSNIQYDNVASNIESSDFSSQNLEVRSMYEKYLESWKEDHDEGDPADWNEWYDNEYQAFLDEREEE